jgi:mono/diheme cytochrome c family protein
MRLSRILLLMASSAVSLGACTNEEPAMPAPVQGADPTVAVHAAEAGTRSMEDRMATGEKLFLAHCAACHQAKGQGLIGVFPPLAASDFLSTGGPAAAIDAVLNGLAGPITVNGKYYNSVMPGLSYLSDTDVADIVTFVFNSWGNPGGEVSSAEVAAVRGGE